MKKKDILLLLISGFILVVAWVGFNIYHTLATSTVSETVVQQILPIPGTFDMRSIEELKKRKKITINLSDLEKQENPTATPSAIPTATPTISITPDISASPSAPISTQGGSLNL